MVAGNKPVEAARACPIAALRRQGEGKPASRCQIERYKVGTAGFVAQQTRVGWLGGVGVHPRPPLNPIHHRGTPNHDNIGIPGVPSVRPDIVTSQSGILPEETRTKLGPFIIERPVPPSRRGRPGGAWRVRARDSARGIPFYIERLEKGALGRLCGDSLLPVRTWRPQMIGLPIYCSSSRRHASVDKMRVDVRPLTHTHRSICFRW